MLLQEIRSNKLGPYNGKIWLEDWKVLVYVRL